MDPNLDEAYILKSDKGEGEAKVLILFLYCYLSNTIPPQSIPPTLPPALLYICSPDFCI